MKDNEEKLFVINNNTLGYIKLFKGITTNLSAAILKQDLEMVREDEDNNFYADTTANVKLFVDVFRDETCIYFLEELIKELLLELKHQSSRTKQQYYEKFIGELKNEQVVLHK